jgi:hypothetical protein
MDRAEAAEFGFLEFSSFDGRAPERARSSPAEADPVLEGIIAEELATLRDAFGQGAEYAVTHARSSHPRMLHRLECSVLEPHLDRRTRWSENHRKRLVADHSYRVELPALHTRDSARALSGVRSCKVCWPNVHGNEPHPVRRLKARGLRSHHVGHVLSTESGSSLGTIVSAATQRQPDRGGIAQPTVEVVTSSQAYYYSPSESVFIWDLPTDEVALKRKMQLFERLR